LDRKRKAQVIIIEKNINEGQKFKKSLNIYFSVLIQIPVLASNSNPKSKPEVTSVLNILFSDGQK